MTAPLNLAKLKADVAPYQPKPFPLDAQPMSISEWPIRISRVPEESRPGFVVSCRTASQIKDAGVFSISAQYKTGIHLFFDSELPDNRFRFQFRKNRYGREVTAIPAVANLLPFLGDWKYEDGHEGSVGFLTVDIVGMIYLKSNFP